MHGSQFFDRNFTDVPLAPLAVTPNFELDAVIPLPDITELTGGGDTALDGIPTANGAMQTGATVLLSYSRVGQTWQLIAGSDATNPSLGVVRPLDYNDSTNQRIWVSL